ncbi:hypothetical protein BSKO_13866 [Bryopsis sp. KO-2023]|nr:hypothetical protein BSKO_13866 [Bryopsis sp. KO-2023]
MENEFSSGERIQSPTMSESSSKIFSVQPSKTLRRFYRGVYNVFKKEKTSCSRASFNPEEQANQKREWLEVRSLQDKALGWPEHIFEHLVIVGIPPTADVHGISRDISREQAKKRMAGGASTLPSRQYEKPNHTLPKPSYTPELLYQFPEEKPLHMCPDALVSFCFPHGVTPTILPRTSSMSALNEVVYGQQHMVQSDKSFIFLQKGGDDLPMFGICYYVNQMVHMPPGLSRSPKFNAKRMALKRHLVVAPRCYCLLSRYPFFDLHFQVLNMLLGLERLDSIKEYVEEVSSLPPRHSLSTRLGIPGNATPTSSMNPTPTPEPLPPTRPVSASPSPPSSARTTDKRRRSFSLGPSHESARRASQIQDSFSSIPGLHKPRKADGGPGGNPREPGGGTGKSAGVRERADKTAGGQAGASPVCSRSQVSEEGCGCCASSEMETSPFAALAGGPSASSSGISDFIADGDILGDLNNEARGLSEREVSLAPPRGPGATSRSSEGTEPVQMPAPSGNMVHLSPWLHARSVSGQSLSNYDGDESMRGQAGAVELSVGSQPRHCRGDSAFYGLEFHSSPLVRTKTATPPMGHSRNRSGDSDPFTNPSSAPGSPWWGLRRTNSEDALSIGGMSLASMYFRSPSCHEIFPRGVTPPVLWKGDVEGSDSRLTAAQSVLLSFYMMPVPGPGERLIFSPEEGLQTIEYVRPKVKAHEGANGSPMIEQRHLGAEVAQIEAEAAAELRIWTIASLCRSLSLENVLSLLAAAMLEKQIVFFCSNIGVLTSAVLALIPLLRPFTWQSLLMPVVPARLLELLDAPVPFAVGLQHKTPEIAHRCGDLVRVNLYKDRIKNAPQASMLPNYRQLVADLTPWHKKLQQSSTYTRRPMHVPTSTEYYAVEGILQVFGEYLSKLVGDLRRHTITEVGTNGERVCLLLEDSLVESFPQKDWPFMRSFVETQMFSSHSDAVISRFE